MSVVPRSGVYGFGRRPSRAAFGVTPIEMHAARFLSGIVTPGTSTYPSQDGTFSIVRGSGDRYGNGLIDGWLIAGEQADGYYALDDNNTGLTVDSQTVGRKYKIGSEYDTFVNSTPTSPEYVAYEKQQRALDEANNPKLKAYDAALLAWALSQQPPVAIDPVYGFATAFDISTAPHDVQATWADFTGNPMPEPAAPPPQPNRYLIDGIVFEDDGTVLDGSGNPTGEKLTPDEVHSLLTTGTLPASSPPVSMQPTVPSASSPTGNPTSQPTAVATTTTPQQSGPAVPAPSGPSDVNPTVPPIIPTVSNQLPAPQPPPSPPPATTPAATGDIGSMLSTVPVWAWAVAGGALLFMSSRRRS